MRRVLALALLAVAATAAEPITVGLILAGDANDGGWNQLAREGGDALTKELGAKVQLLQKVGGDKAAAEMRAFADDGAALVICHGYEFLEPAVEVAGAAKGTKFAVSGADVAKPGIATLDFDVSQASYQLGVIAGSLTKTGKLGFIGGAPFPSVKACYRGFLAGARSVRPDVTVAEAYTSWDQPEKSKAQAEAFIQQGIDAIYPDVDAASRGVYEAVSEQDRKAGAARVVTFGCVSDRNADPVAGDAVLASAVIRLDRAFVHLAKSVQDGSFKPGVIKEDLASGTCVAVINPKATAVTPEIAAKVEAAGKALIAGTVTIPAQ